MNINDGSLMHRPLELLVDEQGRYLQLLRAGWFFLSFFKLQCIQCTVIYRCEETGHASCMAGLFFKKKIYIMHGRPLEGWLSFIGAGLACHNGHWPGSQKCDCFCDLAMHAVGSTWQCSATPHACCLTSDFPSCW